MKIKKSLLILFVFSLAFSLAAIFQISKTKAGVGNNTSGWPWGGSNDGAGNSTGVGWISLNNTNTGAATNFGVNIPTADGNLSGYAWSSNLGWIDFAPAGPYPASPNNSAMRVGNNLKGWARIIGIRDAGANAGGWSGWIKLGSETGDPIAYGITLNSDGTVSKSSNTAYAWSNELGWIDFSQALMTATGTDQLIICPSDPIIFNGSSSDLQAYFWSNFVGAADCSSASPTNVTTLATWGTSNAGVATINASGVLGRVTGVSVGTSNITALYNALNAVTTANIIPAACVPDLSCAADTCSDQTCDGGCPGNIIPGTRSCVNSGNWKEVAP